MADYATLNLRIKNNSFNRGVDKSSGKLSGLMKVMGGFGVALGGVALTKTAFSLMKLGSTANETANKFHVVFSGLGAGADEMSSKFAKDFGLASSSAQGLLANTGDLLTGFGFSDQGAAKLSDTVNRLAGDLSSFQNIPIKQASEALTKAMLGEAESAKLLGIQINQNSPRYKELIKQYTQVEGKTLMQAKALTALTMAQEQSKKATGDYARTKHSFANTLRATGEAWKGLKEQIGKFLISGTDAGGLIGDIQTKISGLTQTLKDNGTQWVMYFKIGINEIKAFGKVMYEILDVSIGNVSRGFTWVYDNFGKMLSNSLNIAKSFGMDLIQIFSAIPNAAADIGKQIMSALISGKSADIGNIVMNSFAKQISAIGANTEKALNKSGVSKFDVKTLGETWNNIGKILNEADAKNKKIEASALKAAQDATKPGGKKPGDDTSTDKVVASAKAAASVIETTLSDAIEKGSVAALELSSRQVTKDDKNLKANEKTEKNTNKTVKVLEKIEKKISSGGSGLVNAFA